MRRPIKLLIAVLIVLAVVYAAGSWYFSGLIVKFAVHPLAEERLRHGAPFNYDLPTPEEVQIAGDGVLLSGWYFDNPNDGGCGAILLHGHTSSRYGMLKYTPLVWPLGCDLLLYDHRYHGNSTGDFGTYGYHEKRDLLAALAWFQTRTNLPSTQIGLIGESYGAATALQAAPLAPSLAFIVADSSFRSLWSIVSEQGVKRFGGWVRLMVPGAMAFAGLRAHFAPRQVSPVDAAPRITSPVLLVHSASDEFTAPQHSVDIAAALPPTLCHRLHLTDWGSTHGQSVDDNLAAYRTLFQEFLAACAPQFGAQR